MAISIFHPSSEYRIIYDYSPTCGSSCLLQVLLPKWSKVVQTKIIVQSAYTSVIEQSLFQWNGSDCNASMNDTIEFYYCHVTINVLNLIGTANFLAAKVTVWIRVSCQAISPTAWEQVLQVWMPCTQCQDHVHYNLSCGDIQLVILQLSQCLRVCVCECLCRCRGVWVGEGEWEVWGDKGRGRMREAEEGKVGGREVM